MSKPSDPRFVLPDQPTVLDVAAGIGADGQLLEIGQRIGPYRIERLLGEGGMGAVYLAEQLEPIERPVALKLIRGQLRGGLAEAYFLVERQALARMDHPAIAKVYDAGTTPQGHLFFAMEWIDGQTLTRYCASHTPALRETLALFMRICMGVHHAHQKGVIHRDLKPSNMLVTLVDGQAVPKIIDFGVAMGTGTGTSAVSSPAAAVQSVGTRGYMSPEQMRGKPGEIDVRSDVYALGVVLLELIAPADVLENASRAGLDNEALHAALCASLGQKLIADPSVARGLAAIPEPLRWLLVRATESDRSRRYDSAQALADDIDRYLRRYPLIAVPATRTYRLRCFASRNRGPILAAAVVTMALIAGTTAAVIGMLRARDAAQRANVEAQKAKETTHFLTDVMSGVDPKKARDLDKTLLHLLLDRAAARASQQLAGQPDVLATIEDAISLSYSSLSEYANAREHAQRAYDAASRSPGPDALQTLQIQRRLARELSYVGDYREANAMFRNNLAALTRTRGADDPETLETAVDLAQSVADLGDLVGGERALEAAMPTIQRVSDRYSDLQIDALTEQASLLTWIGRYGEAEPIFRDVIARDIKVGGPEGTKTLDTMNDFAIMYLESHRFAEAEPILEKMLPIDEKLYGPNHSSTIHIVSNLAGALRQQGTPAKIAASGPYYLRAYQATHKLYGDKHMNTIIATGNYGNYLLDIGDVEQSIAMEQTSLKAALEVLGPNHEVTGEQEFQLGNALLKAKRYDEAEKQFLAAIAEKQKDLGADHWRMGGYIDPLIEDYKAWGKPELATEWQKKRDALKPRPKGES